MKAFSKTVARTVKSNISRFAAITAIIVLGIGFVAGLGMISPKIRDSAGSYLVAQSAADIIVKSVSPSGFESAELERMAEVEKVRSVMPLFTADMKLGEGNARVYILPLTDMKVNRIGLIGGRMPQNNREALAERATDFIKQSRLGDKVEFMGVEREIVGIAANPLTFQKTEEPNFEGEALESIVYLDSKFFEVSLPVTDVYIALEGVEKNHYFTGAYEDKVDRCVQNLATITGGDKIYLTMRQNKSYMMTQVNCEKVDVISLIFPVFFIAVAALVVLTTMTRLIEEERSVIACYKTLGYGNGKIAFKYIGLAALCCLLGCAAGIVVGMTVLPAVVYPAFETLFFMPPMSQAVYLLPGLIASAAMLAAVAGVTAYLVLKELKENPASLLKAKAPKAGKKIFLEKIPFIWKRLKFRYKSTFRNVFRYVQHLLMTVVAVAGSTALVLAGLGLGDVSRAGAGGSASAGSYSMISAVVIIFAAVLCILVIYNLTNMNIGERKREIATLKVLGYQQTEVTGYIYREVFIMALMGIVLGLPLGFGLLGFVFAYLDFGSVSSVMWYSYLAAAGLTVVFVGLVDLLLYKKIKSIGMTSSLKSAE